MENLPIILPSAPPICDSASADSTNCGSRGTIVGIYRKKNPCISGPARFKGQLYFSARHIEGDNKFEWIC